MSSQWDEMVRDYFVAIKHNADENFVDRANENLFLHKGV